jgi:hypothetical protein
MPTALAPPPAGTRRFVTLLEKGLYVGIVAVMSGIVLMGFWPFYSGLLSGRTNAHWIMYIHAGVFSGWMLLLFVQVVLTYRRRVRSHQRLGRFGIYYGLLVLTMGLVITVIAPVQQVASGRSSLDEAAGFLILPLGDMLLFSIFFTAGIAFRRSRELHKRLMVLATVALLFAPAARIGGDMGSLAILLIWLLPLGLAIAHDAVTRRRLEPVYLAGATLLLFAFARITLMDSEIWLPTGRRLILTFSQM